VAGVNTTWDIEQKENMFVALEEHKSIMLMRRGIR
jgi:hypothetical protein